jgi:hypothetical protein
MLSIPIPVLPLVCPPENSRPRPVVGRNPTPLVGFADEETERHDSDRLHAVSRAEARRRMAQWLSQPGPNRR